MYPMNIIVTVCSRHRSSQTSLLGADKNLNNDDFSYGLVYSNNVVLSLKPGLWGGKKIKIHVSHNL